jgi:hypothetical protein
MKKDTAEAAIRHLARDFRDTLPEPDREHPSFAAFTAWLEKNGHSKYLGFRSLAGAHYDAEMWFDDEFGQNWRR